MNCIFCNSEQAIIKGKYSYVMWDEYPVAPGHCLIIPYRHISTPFELTTDELLEMKSFGDDMYLKIKNKFHPDGCNIGFNVGKYAGQTIPHVHLHIIPRYKGDVENFQGGIRGVIPSKQNY